jgi:hypothetical protein
VSSNLTGLSMVFRMTYYYDDPRPGGADDVRRLVDISKYGVIWTNTQTGRITATAYGVSFGPAMFNTYPWNELAERPDLAHYAALLVGQDWYTKDGWKDVVDALADLAE